MAKKIKQPTDTHLKDEIIDYLIKDRGMEGGGGTEPYWMYTFSSKNDSYSITIWFTNNGNANHLPASVEIHGAEGETYYQGAIFRIEDLKRILYLIFDCYENGYVVIQNKK